MDDPPGSARSASSPRPCSPGSAVRTRPQSTSAMLLKVSPDGTAWLDILGRPGPVGIDSRSTRCSLRGPGPFGPARRRQEQTLGHRCEPLTVGETKTDERLDDRGPHLGLYSTPSTPKGCAGTSRSVDLRNDPSPQLPGPRQVGLRQRHPGHRHRASPGTGSRRGSANNLIKPGCLCRTASELSPLRQPAQLGLSPPHQRSAPFIETSRLTVGRRSYGGQPSSRRPADDFRTIPERWLRSLVLRRRPSGDGSNRGCHRLSCSSRTSSKRPVCQSIAWSHRWHLSVP